MSKQPDPPNAQTLRIVELYVVGTPGGLTQRGLVSATGIPEPVVRQALIILLREGKIGTTYRSRSTPAPVYVRPDRSAPTRRNSYAGKEILRETILRNFSDVDTFSLSDIANKLSCTRQSAAGAMRTLEAYKLAAFVREKRVRGGRAKVYTIKHRDAPEFRMPPTEGTAAAVSAIDRFWYKKETASCRT